jgi:hypothetical protein
MPMSTTRITAIMMMRCCDDLLAAGARRFWVGARAEDREAGQLAPWSYGGRSTRRKWSFRIDILLAVLHGWGGSRPLWPVAGGSRFAPPGTEAEQVQVAVGLLEVMEDTLRVAVLLLQHLAVVWDMRGDKPAVFLFLDAEHLLQGRREED